MVEYESNTRGLWNRFIVNLCAALFFTYYISVFLLKALNIVSDPLIFTAIIIIILAIVAKALFKENPLNWRNTVVIDFEREIIIVNNTTNESEKSNILDFEGKRYSFREIDNYLVIHYEIFWFSSYYLVKIFVNKKEIKLLSFKEAAEFTEFIGLLNNRLNLKIKGFYYHLSGYMV